MPRSVSQLRGRLDEGDPYDAGKHGRGRYLVKKLYAFISFAMFSNPGTANLGRKTVLI